MGDIDSARTLIRVGRGKGGRYCHVMLSPDLLALLRAWWQKGRCLEVMRPGGWLFPGQDPSKPIRTRRLARVVEDVAQTAGITEHVSPQTLRHSFAADLLEDGVDSVAARRRSIVLGVMPRRRSAARKVATSAPQAGRAGRSRLGHQSHQTRTAER